MLLLFCLPLILHWANIDRHLTLADTDWGGRGKENSVMYMKIWKIVYPATALL